MFYSIGIDVGSTTLKTVVLDENGDIIEKSYKRHLSRVRETTVEHIVSLEKILRGKNLKVMITGSAGLGLAENNFNVAKNSFNSAEKKRAENNFNSANGLRFVQEVFAAAGAVNKILPETDVVIELGGEDAKIIFLSGTLEERMNGSCAGGTGAFIDQMATLMNVSIDDLDELYPKHKRIYPIASRCGVFAKSDIQSLLNQGAKKEDIAASIFQAVVDQVIGGLAQGRAIKGRVLFLGGPLSFFKGLQNRFIETLGLSQENAAFPELAPYFMALGSAYKARELPHDEIISYDALLEKFLHTNETESSAKTGTPLFASRAEYEEFFARHYSLRVPETNIHSYSGGAFLGIDAGSTTTKIVLIAEDNSILYKFYSSNGGNPLPVIREKLHEIFLLCEKKIKIFSSAVTGYGEELIKAAFGIDFGIVETIAHFSAARHFNENVNFIIDIGGQDIKCFHIKNGMIDSVVLNEACSSGCGSFVETFATALGYGVDEFSKIAMQSKNPVDLGSRCTVFMNSSFKQAQKDGATIEDISAGLAMSVVKNALYKVIRVRNTDELGENIVVQGGTFLNDAVLRCFETELGREVTRLPISELMGAYGAALYCKKNFCAQKNLISLEKIKNFSHETNLISLEKEKNFSLETNLISLEKEKNFSHETKLISLEKIKNFSHKSKSSNCNACANKCLLTINIFPDGNFISGNRCERGAGAAAQKNIFNLVAFKYDYILNYPTYGTGRLKIGLPLVMNMYETIPFWSTFFSSLGCDVILSEPSTRALYMKGQHTIPSDTVCYPAKLAHGHIESLIEKNVDAIFYPCQTYNIDEGISDNCYNCPVVAYYPEVIAANINLNVKFSRLHIGFQNKKKFIARIFCELKKIIPSLKKNEIKIATERAFEAYDAYFAHIENQAQLALVHAEKNNLPVIVLGCRPYHIDPEINHGIDK
ncbi:MAG: acyl-CoA dehydratase activase, partial [Defluviitaleaceae bacterium]|nr:acyl-CoA dehydratase activase [Defluviitaleaceae bacterium]